MTNSEQLKEFSEQLKTVMKKCNISQTELCEKTGIPKSAISQYLSGKFRPKQKRTYILAQALHTTPEFLMGLTDNVDTVSAKEKDGNLSIEVKSKSRWIPVEEALPEVYERVLTADKDGNVIENFRCNIKTGALEWSKGFWITHWMPLPEPPESEVQHD